MAYTFREAIKTAYKYLEINNDKVRVIENTSGRGIVYSFDGVETVIFIYPISCKQDNKQNFFDTRDSGAKERAAAWQYAVEHGLRYFCFGFNEEQERYKNYILSLESDERSISNISFRKAVDSSATGTQVNIPADFIPKTKFERIKTPKGFYISAIQKEYITDYIRFFDNRPYMYENVDSIEEESEEAENLREQFEQYIISVLGLKSTRQVGDLAKLSTMLLEAGVIDKDVYEISDPDEYAHVVEIIHNSDEYKNDKQEKKDKSPSSGLAYDQGITNYARFLNFLKNDIGEKVIFRTGIVAPFSRNRIIFGAPGTGKSYITNRDRIALLGENNDENYERVTFHPDYSFANFVGTYKPIMRKSTSTLSVDADADYVLSVLNDGGKTGQEKYDMLFETFQKDNSLTRLPLLLGLYTDELFRTKKADGSDAADSNSVERNHGRAIRKYVSLINGKNQTDEIAYEYVPGPFMRLYVNALKSARSSNPKPYLLIIEEINRANVAAVFGDVFQLLDRDEYGVSEYPIQASEDVKQYLAKELGGDPEDYCQIRIPDNLFIWATMNSADQGVFPMDTAFKRRWDFTYLGIDDSDKDIRGKYVTVGKHEKQVIEWNSLRKAINEFLAEERINEDKQLGPFFLARSIVVPSGGADEIDSIRFCDAFKHKVLMYLFEDAAKQKRSKLFEGSKKGQNRYSKICEAFDEQGIGIFHVDIQNRVIKKSDTLDEGIKGNVTE